MERIFHRRFFTPRCLTHGSFSLGGDNLGEIRWETGGFALTFLKECFFFQHCNIFFSFFFHFGKINREDRILIFF